MKNQNHEIVPNKMNEIEPLNEIVELDLENLEAITGGARGDCEGKCGFLLGCNKMKPKDSDILGSEVSSSLAQINYQLNL